MSQEMGVSVVPKNPHNELSCEFMKCLDHTGKKRKIIINPISLHDVFYRQPINIGNNYKLEILRHQSKIIRTPVLVIQHNDNSDYKRKFVLRVDDFASLCNVLGEILHNYDELCNNSNGTIRFQKDIQLTGSTRRRDNNIIRVTVREQGCYECIKNEEKEVIVIEEKKGNDNTSVDKKIKVDMRYYYIEKTKEGEKTDLQKVEYPTKAGVRFDVNEPKFIYNMRSYIIHQLYKLEKLNQGLDIVGTAIANDYGGICDILEKTGVYDEQKKIYINVGNILPILH